MSTSAPWHQAPPSMNGTTAPQAPQPQRTTPQGLQSIQQSLVEWYERQLQRDRSHDVLSRQPRLPQDQDAAAGLYRVVRRPGRRRDRGLQSKLPAYLQRGTTMWCLKCYVSGPTILFLFLVGSMTLLSGIFVVATQSANTGALLLFGGFGLILLYMFLCRKARKEFQALPADHPDRLYYSSSTVAVYTTTELPPGTTITPAAAAMVSYPVAPPRRGAAPVAAPLAAPVYLSGTVVPPVAAATTICLPPDAQMGHYPTPPSTPLCIPGYPAEPRPYNPDDDKPPAYDDLFK